MSSVKSQVRFYYSGRVTVVHLVPRLQLSNPLAIRFKLEPYLLEIDADKTSCLWWPGSDCPNMLLSLLFLTGIAIHCAGIQVTPASLAWGVPFVYHDQEELTQFLRQVVHYFPELASLYSIGRSVQRKSPSPQPSTAFLFKYNP